MDISATSPTAARRQWFRHLLAIAAICVFFALPATVVQLMSLQTTISMNQSNNIVMDRKLDFDTAQRVEKIDRMYANVLPWETWARWTGVAFTVLAPFLSVLVSLRYFCFAAGSLPRRFMAAMGLAASFAPIFILCNLPWGLYYWVGDDWDFAVFFMLITSGVVFTLAALFNGVTALVLMLRRPRQRQDNL
jgi:hypothetical protein